MLPATCSFYLIARTPSAKAQHSGLALGEEEGRLPSIFALIFPVGPSSLQLVTTLFLYYMSFRILDRNISKRKMCILFSLVPTQKEMMHTLSFYVLENCLY